MLEKATVRYNIMFKVICLTVAFCFLAQQICWAANGTHIWSMIKGNQVLDAQVKDFVKFSDISIPEDFGTVREIFNSGNERIIIHIQDAHSNLGAQESISRLIGSLEQNYSLKLVFLEGAYGFVDTSTLSCHPDDKIRKDLAQYFLNRGKINAAEYYKISSKSDVKLYGAETPQLYKDNVSAYIESLGDKGEIHKAIITLKKTTRDLKEKIYSGRLIELDQKRTSYQTEDISFKEYWQYLGNQAKSLKIEASKYKTISALISASGLEEKIDFQKAEDERKQLIEALTKSIDNEQIEGLLKESAAFKLNRIPSSTFHSHLFDLAKKAKVGLSDYPNLSNYVDYVNIHDDISQEALFQELDELIWHIQEALLQNDDQKQLAIISRQTDILVDLLDAKIINKDLEYYKAHRDEFIPQAIAHQLTKLMVKYNITTNLVPDMRVVTKTLPAVERFYEAAEKRNKALVENTLAKMEKDKCRLSVLITGGFHTEGIRELLKQKKVSYVVVLPKFSHDSLERSYEDVILNKKEPFEEILSNNEYYLAPASIFSNFQAPLEALVALATEVMYSGAVSEKDNLDKGEELGRWLFAYRNARYALQEKNEIPGPVSFESFEKTIQGFNFIPVGDGTIFAEFHGNVFRVIINEVTQAGQRHFEAIPLDGEQKQITLNLFERIRTSKPVVVPNTKEFKQAQEITEQLRIQQEKFSTQDAKQEAQFRRQLQEILQNKDKQAFDIAVDKLKRTYSKRADEIEHVVSAHLKMVQTAESQNELLPMEYFYSGEQVNWNNWKPEAENPNIIYLISNPTVKASRLADGTFGVFAGGESNLPAKLQPEEEFKALSEALKAKIEKLEQLKKQETDLFKKIEDIDIKIKESAKAKGELSKHKISAEEIKGGVKDLGSIRNSAEELLVSTQSGINLLTDEINDLRLRIKDAESEIGHRGVVEEFPEPGYQRLFWFASSI